MSYLRIEIDLQIDKPLPAGFTVAKRQAVRDALVVLESVAVKINQGQPNEEPTNLAVLTNTAESLKYHAHLAIPEYPGGTRVLGTTGLDGKPTGGIFINPAIAGQLATIRPVLRQLKQFAKRSPDIEFRMNVLICHHDSNGVLPDEQVIEV